MPARNGAVGVPLDLRVVVGVQVDEAGRDDQPLGVKQLVGVGGVHSAAHLGDDAVLDSDIRLEAGHPCAIDDCAATNQNIKLGHLSLLQASPQVRRIYRLVLMVVTPSMPCVWPTRDQAAWAATASYSGLARRSLWKLYGMSFSC